MPEKVKYTTPWYSSPSTDPAQTLTLPDGPLMIPMISDPKTATATATGNDATHAPELLP